MEIIIGTKNKAKCAAVEAVLSNYYNNVEFISIDAPSNVSDQPFSSKETRQGAMNRANYCQQTLLGDMHFGLEGGVEEIDGVMYCVNWGAVTLKNGTVYTAQGASFVLPEEIAVALKAGEELGPVMDRYTSRQNIRHHEGAIGIFTNGLVNRMQMFEHIVTLLIGQVQYYEKFERDI